MPLAAKICGVNSPDAAQAVIDGGAAFMGLVFFQKSPRNVSPVQAADLAALVPNSIKKVGVVVDPSDADLKEILAATPLDMIQLHGHETPQRVAEIRRKFGVDVMKAIKVAGADDLAAVAAFESVSDWLLFDAKPPKTMASALPGGNALAFDWTLLAGARFSRPWMLSGGLTPENVSAAATVSGATVVDVSSGVEDKPGVKNPAKISAFLAATNGI
ncbi:MAG: phosphoribosylanthranilate isomerase [Alphaproteobacteria bacterium]|jgi:phosphoribosylanthranilate isomerase|nr:phosphoribosylanthranilate isomerase [Alphaproteobacteria bacterium]MBT4711356.1 phosphoribosylanthranilate isomerase [Alphaproteobacteria bacterium]MBT5859559.1 phosphoribosylanthranilate isomerase [Alphaproteobacteria bacterium]